MKSKHVACGSALFFLLLFSAAAAPASTFTADLVVAQGGKSEIGKFYYQDGRYRLDIVEDDRD